MPTDCIFQMTVFENEYFLVFGKLKPRNRNRKIYLKDDKRKCILWDSYYLATLAVIERIRIEYKRYIHSIESKDHDLVYMSILDEIARRYQALEIDVPYMLMKKSRFCIQKSCNFLTSWKFL